MEYMKYTKYILVILMAIIFISACTADNDETRSTTDNNKQNVPYTTDNVGQANTETSTTVDIYTKLSATISMTTEVPTTVIQTVMSPTTEVQTTIPTTMEPTESQTTVTYFSTDDELKTEAERIYEQNINIYNSVLEYTNQIRMEAGKPALMLNKALCVAATMRAIEMDYSNYLNHIRPDGRNIFTIYEYIGYNYRSAGENIAKGYATPQAVVNAWKNSKGHYENIISDKYNNLGVGFSNTVSGVYFVQLFAD